MNRTVIWLLIVIVVGAVSAVAFLMLDGPLSGEGGLFDRAGAEGEGDVLIDPVTGEVVLKGAENAKRAPTKEEIEAAKRKAEKPKFARAEGVFGQVVNGSGDPVPKAVVKLMALPETTNWWQARYAPDPAPLATAVTDEKGEFLVGPAPEEARLRVRAEAGGYAPTIQTLKCRGYRVDMVLDKGGGLEVTVKDDSGGVVSGALVFHRAGSVTTEGRTGENGVATFGALPTGTGLLLVSSEGHASLQQNNVAVAPGKVEKRTVVLPKPIVIEGRTIADVGEQPLPGVEIVVRYPNQPWLDASSPVTTDETGRFEVEALAPLGQSVTIAAKAADRPDTQLWTQIQDAGGGRMTLDVKMPAERGSFTGRVTDVDGHGLAGAKVAYAYYQPGQERVEATSGAGGEFELEAAPWVSGKNASAQLVATAPGEGLGSTWARLPKKDGPPTEITIKLSGNGRVEGSVTDGAGEPVSGALVELQVDYASIQKLQKGGRRVDYGMLYAISNPNVARVEAITGEDGSYVITDVPSTTYRASVTFGLLSVMDEDPLDVSGGQTARRDLVLGEGLTLEGWVRDAEGLPIPGAYVYANPTQRTGPGWGGSGGNKNCRSQSDGKFVMHGVQNLNYTVSASATGYGSKNEQNIAGGVTDLELILVPRGWIDGLIELDGVGYAGTFTVRARRVRQPGQRNRRNYSGPMPAGVPGSYSGSGGSGTYSPDDGKFKLEGLGSSEYDLSATTPEGWITTEPLRVRVADGVGTRATLILTRGAIVKGRLIEDLTGKPVVRARIYVSARPGAGNQGSLPTASAQTDSEGRFQLRGLGSGAYLVRVYPPSGSNFEKPLDLQAGEEREIELREEAPGTIQVLALDTDGAPVTGITPQIQSESGRTVWVNWQRLQKEEGFTWGANTWRELTTTNDSGINVRRFVTPGRYKITAYGKGYRTTEPLWVEVRPGGTVEAQIILQKNTPRPTPAPPR